ncbi:MAG TPA: hypothetical protein VMM84_11685 [Pyrinomonadaceae bacterium]|nr:hypothetical protein [Pyrinomonadaceae bacterium]
MKGINVTRWLIGGVVAGILIWLFEGAASMLYYEQMQAALEARGLALETSAKVFIISILVSLLAGLTLVFFYAAARPRFGPGPKTALIVAVALFIGSYLITLLGYELLGLAPTRLLVIWGVIGLTEMILATLVGAWLYNEA